MSDQTQERSGARRPAGTIGVAVAVLVAAIAALVLASQIGDPANTSGVSFLSAWRDATLEAGSYRFSLKQDVSGPDAPQQLGELFKLEGIVDPDSNLLRTVTSLNVLGVATKCTYITKPDSLTYVAVHPSRVSEFGAKWLRTDADSGLVGAQFPIRPDRIDDDPERFFTDLKEDGTDVIRGVQTVRYTGTFDLSSIYESAQPATPQPTSADAEVPVKVYVDGDDLVRRILLEVSSSEDLSINFTLDFFDYGKATELKEPLPADTKPGSPEQIATACFPKDLGLRE
jgi:hypothetical protein